MKKSRLFRQASDNAAASMDAARVIAARTPMILRSGGGSTAAEATELRRMVQEKSEAAAEGAVAGAAALGSFWLDVALGKVRKPADVAAGLMKVAHAATKPARQRVRANAKRLGK